MGNSVSDFEKRYSLSEIIAQRLPDILNKDDAELVLFGSETISKDSEALNAFITNDDSRRNFSSMLVKFAPDFILLDKNKNEVFFLEIKVSVTPLCLETNREQMKKIDGKTPDITEIADMDRDAWNAYVNLFPRTIILDACLYNPKLLGCQFVGNIKCLRCFKEYRTAFNCDECPVYKRGLFDQKRNFKSEGSQTPHMNFSLRNFYKFGDFFTKLGIRYDAKKLDELLDEIKKCHLNFPKVIYPEKRKEIVNDLVSKGCYWLNN